MRSLTCLKAAAIAGIGIAGVAKVTVASLLLFEVGAFLFSGSWDLSAPDHGLKAM